MNTVTDKTRLLAQSGLFDETWYVERYPDVLRCAMSPIEHYVRIGHHIGRKPNARQDGAEASQFLAAWRSTALSAEPLDDETRRKILESRLFDAKWYRARFAQALPDDVDTLDDYLNRSASDPTIDPGPLFSTTYYAQKSPDSSSTLPLVHACLYGLAEGRPVFDAIKVDTFLTEERDRDCTPFAGLLDRSRSVKIVYWNNGNFFFSEIAEYLCAYLQNQGFEATLQTDLARSTKPEGTVIVVAPHEFCVHGPGKAWHAKQLAHAIYLNTEQWHTSWFSLSYNFMKMSNKAIDINPASASGLQALGIETAFLPIVPMPGTPFSVDKVPISDGFAKARYIRELTYPNDYGDRPYDVLFVGASNVRREAALASIAPVLAEKETFIHCPRFSGPVRAGDPDMMSTSDLVQFARNSKILLNIHQGESRYFEWHRLFLFGIMEGCVVLTEPSIPNAFVQAERHYLECELREMPERLRWLLGTQEGQAKMAQIRGNCEQLRRGEHAWMMIA